MKWNTEQLELSLTQKSNTYRSFRHRSQRRLQRASWWFEQMRKAVDRVEAWDGSSLDSGVASFHRQEQPTLEPAEEDHNREISVQL